MSYGPTPWQQTSWDARAAANFIAGGAGSGLFVFAWIDSIAGATRPAPMLLLAALALIGFGLTCVWLEIGRPLRALNVFINPRTSWMSREAFVALILFGVGVAALFVSGVSGLAAALALAFVYCQARMLRAARGIPAWREPALTPFMVVTGLVEGGGLFFLAAPLTGRSAEAGVVAIAALALVRILSWLVYRRRLAAALAPGAAAALDRAGRALAFVGTLLPITGFAMATAGALTGGARAALLAAAGVLAAGAGAYVKYVLITQAGFNQGFALAHLPVRGARP